MMDESFPFEKVFPRLAMFMLYATVIHDVESPKLGLIITVMYIGLLLLIFHTPRRRKKK